MEINSVGGSSAASVAILNKDRQQSEKVADTIMQGVEEGAQATEKAASEHKLDVTA